MSHPPVVIVDARDRPIGEAPLADARRKGLVYRIVFVIAEDADGRLLLQRRAPHMQIYPSCWDVAAGGHVDDGNDYRTAAALEVREELGLADPHLKEVAHGYSDAPLWGGIPAKRFVKIYKMQINALPKHLGAEEVTEVRWFTRQEALQLIARHPEKIAEGLELAHAYGCL